MPKKSTQNSLGHDKINLNKCDEALARAIARALYKAIAMSKPKAKKDNINFIS